MAGVPAACQAANIWSDIVAAGGVPAGDAYSAPYVTNLNSASAMTGTTGTFTNMTGQLPTGYVGSNTTGATVAASIVTRDGRNYIRLAISGTCTTADRVRIRRSITHTHALNDVFVNMARLKYSAAAGGAPVGLRSIGVISHSNARWMTASYPDGGTGLFADAGALSERVVRRNSRCPSWRSIAARRLVTAGAVMSRCKAAALRVPWARMASTSSRSARCINFFFGSN